MKELLILIGVLTVVTATTVVFSNRLRQESRRPAQPASETVDQASAGEMRIGLSLTEKDGAPALEVAVVPQIPEISLLSFALEVALFRKTGAPLTDATALVLDPTLIAEGWSFPIAALSHDAGTTTVKLSGVHVSTTAFLLTNRQVIAQFRVDPSLASLEDVTVNVNRDHTKFLRKNATAISVQPEVVIP